MFDAPCESVPQPKSQPCIITLFGATGDLTRRKLIPALFSLHTQNLLPDPFVIVAYARKQKDNDIFRNEMLEAINEFAGTGAVPMEKWRSFASNIHYHQAELGDADGYRSLKTLLAELNKRYGLCGNHLYYLATPPDYFSTIIEHLRDSGLTHAEPSELGWNRIMIEKPFGRDLDSARELNELLKSSFQENDIFRVDHYLGKETVQNILVMRFANHLFELLWNHLYIDHIQITVAETLGMEGRGAYFDKAGICRDIIQNHALQILTLIAMEPPISLDPNHIRDEKVKALRSIRPFRKDELSENTVRAQYVSDGTNPGYSQEPGVQAGSQSETYASLRFHVDNWRWSGVPFYVRAGKRLPSRATEVCIQLKAAPDVLFARMECMNIHPNRIVFRIQPNEGVEIYVSAKEPEMGMSVKPVRMRFDYSEEFGRAIPDAYERLIVNAMQGDTSLFARDDEVEEAWKLLQPVLDGWSESNTPPCNYRIGEWGPANSDALLAKDGRRWWNR